MKKEQIKLIQQRINTIPDGIWGPKSVEACKNHLRSLMPKNNPWPKSDSNSLTRFYGEAGDESNLVTITLPFKMYYEGQPVTKTRVHRKCADSLIRILRDIQNRYGDRPEIMSCVTDYGGIFNNRNKRGGSTKSLHAYGAAIDLDADQNGFRDKWPTESEMPLEVMECFAREGWLSAGAFWGYDGMHHQATL